MTDQTARVAPPSGAPAPDVPAPDVPAPDVPALDVVALTRALVAVDSTNPGGDEPAALAVLADLFSSRGLSPEVDRYRDGHANLVVRVPFGPGPTLMLNSHIDVVPAGGGWAHDPFTPVVADGRLYGRGSADAKGSLAAMAVALLELVDSGAALSGTVVFTAVGDEEGGSTGARHLITSLRPDACVVGEPTGLQLLSAHKGSVRPVIEVRGVPAHAATPHLGANAVEGAAELVLELRRLAVELLDRDHELTGGPTMTTVFVSGGEAPNAVPERCRITLDRRLVPGEDDAGALAEVQAVLDRFNAGHPRLSAAVVECAPSTGGPSETPRDHPFVAAAVAGMAAAGERTDLGGLVVNCDMTTFRAAGVPTVIVGPGTLEVMHAIDEHVPVEQLHRAVAVHRAIVESYLAGAR
ncbi:ArgE/DapE family deacylase [Auraticoccus sp. F435]|uniref:Probable succinyl-diaminopimelate desuccinylase n=1 Tax=Auraticoccus cholistanensis TaxID=2656650 RepID=A0A6A9V2A2_9ACTN|nr:M20 family metallopeptidase [Auraticoccus cholistanensis]MVA77707.1 ArgE/DapE family deacylase [Auraticoccus cholistanensis]